MYNPVWIIRSSVKARLALEILICQTRAKVASLPELFPTAAGVGILAVP